MLKNNNKRILIVEDEALVSEMVKTMLEEAGYEIVGEASDGREALAEVRRLLPDVVLMDIQMPNEDGISAARRIQETVPTPVVVLTAHESESLVKEASEAGVGAFLVKPPRVSEMERAITIAMARFDDMMTLRRLNQELSDALAKVKLLSGLLPICASCKKIRDDSGYWQQLEVYIAQHSEASFTHGICPDCTKELYPDFFSEDDE
ncbi:MAG: response regulator [Chloroflexota bacterium]